MEDFKKQFNKGVLELVILHLLNEKPHYGYSLIQDIHRFSDGKIDIKDGTLYPILYRLEDNAYIASYWETADIRSKKPRKYYKISESGTHRFEKMYHDYCEVQTGIDQILRNGENDE